MPNVPQHSKRVVEAPAAQLAQPNRILSVVLSPDEDVQWIWSHSWDGGYVSGYHIVKAAPND
jgi:hypothetical protein